MGMDGVGSRGGGHEGWRVADLALLPGGRYGSARAVSDGGFVVGVSECADRTDHAVLWHQGDVIDLGTLGGSASVASGVNRHGVVVGSSETAVGASDRHAFRWENGRMTDLGTLGGVASAAAGINDRGWVVGHSETVSGATHACLWIGGELSDLGVLAASGMYQSSRAFDVDDSGRIVGQAGVDVATVVPAMWEHGQIRQLGELTGSAAAINAHGQVVGGLSSGSESFLWSDDDVAVIGPVQDEPHFEAVGIDNAGRVVGRTGFRSFVWHGGRLDWLAGLSAGATSVSDISSDGLSIVGGSSRTPDGLTPAPVIWTQH